MEASEGKKKARKRPGRHLKQNRRVEQRERMQREREEAQALAEAEADQNLNEQGAIMAENVKVFHEKSPFLGSGPERDDVL